MTDRELMQKALEALEPYAILYGHIQQVVTALRERLAQPEQDGTCSHCDGAGCVACDARYLPQQEPVAWVYPEGLEALKSGKPWTAYGGDGSSPHPDGVQRIPLYLHPVPEREPYAWVTFTAYGDEDDVWYENPEGKLLEGWTYKPLYTTPPRREWVGLTDEERNKLWRDVIGWGDPSHDDEDLMKAIEAKLKEKNA